MRVNLSETLYISPLKGDQISARGFDPGLGDARHCALKGHQNAARRVEFISPQALPSFSRHFQGAFLDGGYPGLKPRLRKAYVAAKLSDYAGRQTRARRSVAKEAWASMKPNLSRPAAKKVFS
jgi:hypothetical protein